MQDWLTGLSDKSRMTYGLLLATVLLALACYLLAGLVLLLAPPLLPAATAIPTATIAIPPTSTPLPTWTPTGTPQTAHDPSSVSRMTWSSFVAMPMNSRLWARSSSFFITSSFYALLS